jgi:hypothetical protein
MTNKVEIMKILPTPFRKWGGLKTNKMAEKAETKYLKLSGLEP